jgi:hypothetical protein
MANETARERFRKAVGILADEKDRIKERLLIAYASQLTHVEAEYDLPKAMVADFDVLRNALSDTGMPYGYGEPAAKKLQDMTEDDAAELARVIYRMFLQLHELEPHPAAPKK